MQTNPISAPTDTETMTWRCCNTTVLMSWPRRPTKLLLHRQDAYDRDDPRSGESGETSPNNAVGLQQLLPIRHELRLGRFLDIEIGR